MIITDFTADHIKEAALIARQNYQQERSFVTALPPIDNIPNLKPYAENGLGVAAFEGETMIGFLCSVSPFSNAFGSTNATGVFSPMGANGVIGINRANVYARLYQAASKKWVHAGATSHAICLYSHDRKALEQFFRYGFGIRCVDAIRGMNEVAAPPCEGYSFYELPSKDVLRVLPLENMLDDSYIEAPFFMYREKNSEAAFIQNYRKSHPIYFVAEQEEKLVAFIRAELDGENFIMNTPGYLHIKGAYCLPEHRGRGINQKLLSMLIQKLKMKGYTRLGVDYESLNPTAYGFWRKYFDAYTYSVVRRIDEKAVYQ